MQNLARKVSEGDPALSPPGPTTQLGLVGASDSTAEAGSIADDVRAAWVADARCVECGQPIDRPAHAALLVSAKRVAHRRGCFVRALVRDYPLLTQRACNSRQTEPPSDADAPKRDGGIG
ncbi:MAG: hypothetical protein M3081_15875 [Gemmatimonadota bacterium]|nr:hypothetical protein [Gemmatimonadota bacterium]